MVTLSPAQSFKVRVLDLGVDGTAIVAAANPRPGITFTIKIPIPTRPTGVVIIEAQVRVIHSVLARDQDWSSVPWSPGQRRLGDTTISGDIESLVTLRLICHATSENPMLIFADSEEIVELQLARTA